MFIFYMLALLQRVTHASVTVKSQLIGKIGPGLLVFVGVERDDTESQADRLLERILGYRIFGDEADKMNLSVSDVQGGILLVPQFTLAADTQKGMRPSFSSAAEPKRSRILFDYLLTCAQQQYRTVASGEFGAEMHVELCNHGPVTFLLKA